MGELAVSPNAAPFEPDYSANQHSFAADPDASSDPWFSRLDSSALTNHRFRRGVSKKAGWA